MEPVAKPTEEEYPPMKRSEFLKPLSHDHHQSLFLAQRLRRAEATDVDEVARTYVEHWHAEGARHFREEEEILLPVYVEHGGGDDPLIGQVLLEHVQIRSLVQTIERDLADTESATDLDRVHRIGELLHDHVRLEERELFPKIEQALPTEVADQLIDQLSVE